MHIYHLDRGLSNKIEHLYKEIWWHSQDAPVFFFFFSLRNLEYKVVPSSPETSIHNEWLVNLMYATVESCSACGRPCLRLGWDHNEAIFLTDFSTCRSSDAPEPLAHLGAASSAAALAVQPGDGGITWLASQPHHSRDNHTPLQLLMPREVFSFISITLPRWHFQKLPLKKSSNIYSQMSVWLMLFFSALLHLALPGWRFSRNHAFCLGSPPGKFWEIIFIDWLGVI